MMWYGFGNMVWMWPWMIVGSLILLAGLVAIVFLVVKAARGGDAALRPHQPSSARQILDERYARGEIDDDEYQRRRAALQ